jgi:hypothetical protein
MVGIRLALVAIFSAIVVLNWPSTSEASSGTLIDVMPAAWYTRSVNVYEVLDYGVHYDEALFLSRAAYDFSPSDGDKTFIRGMAVDNQAFAARYMFWRESQCLIRARLQRYVFNQWVNYYEYDLHFIHSTYMHSGTQYTGSVSVAGWWFSRQIGVFSSCGTQSGPHVHISAIPSQYVSVSPRSDNTCWDNYSYCNIGQVKGHQSGSVCPPGQWNGLYGTKSGTARPVSSSEYFCAEWQARWRSVDHPAFRLQ